MKVLQGDAFLEGDSGTSEEKALREERHSAPGRWAVELSPAPCPSRERQRGRKRQLLGAFTPFQVSFPILARPVPRCFINTKLHFSLPAARSPL